MARPLPTLQVRQLQNCFVRLCAHFLNIDKSNMVLSCRIPDDCIDSKRYPLFMARDVMRVLIEQLQAEGATPS